MSHLSLAPLRAAISSFGQYRRLPQAAGGWFMPVAFAARLPIAMLPLGTLGLVSGYFHSVGKGGLAAGAISVGAGIGGPILGHLADRFSQRAALLVAAPLSAAALAGGVVAVVLGAPFAVALAALFLAGVTAPQVAALVRVRWMHLSTKHQGILGVALSYESTADEISYVVGPAAVGVLASLFGPVVPMVVAIALTALAVPAFALHPTGKLAVAPAADADPAARSSAGSQPAKTGLLRLIGIVAAPLLGTLGAGLFFGGTQASVTAAAGAAGSPQVSGLMYCVLGFGSAITALALVIVPDRISLTTRWRVLSAGQLLSACLFLAVTGLAPLTAVLALVGLFVGPTMVTVLTIGSDLAPRGREAMTMTLIQSGNVLGVAAGASLAGAIADAAGSRWAFIVPIVACAVLAAAAYIPRRRRDS